MSDLQDTGFWSRFWSRLTGKTQLNKGGSSHPMGDYTSSGGAIVNPETALKLSAVWACVKLRAETISTLPLIYTILIKISLKIMIYIEFCMIHRMQICARVNSGKYSPPH